MNIKQLTKPISLLAVCFTAMFAVTASASTLNAPDVEDVFGGRISWMDAIATSASTTRVFVTTESANSMFYADVDHATSPPTFGSFQVVPDLDDSAGYGSGINRFSVDEGTGTIFFIHNGNLYATTTTPSTTGSVSSLGIGTVVAHDGMLFFTQLNGSNLELHFGTITAGSEDPSSPLIVSSSGESANRIVIDPSTDQVHVFVPGSSSTPPAIYTTSDIYSSLSSSTTFNAMTTTDLAATGIEFSAFGVCPDGRVFVGGVEDLEPNHEKYVAYTDVGGDPWTTFNTTIGGTSGANVECAGSASTYNVYFGAGVSDNKGVSGSWNSLPNGGSFDTHANDGTSWQDPNNSDYVYITTDLGFGVTPNAGVDIMDISDGIEAVQVNGFDMNSGKTIGWTASKSGVRQVVDYTLSSESWNNNWPMGDGSPYYSIAMDHSDTTGDTAYAGNVRLYKTTDGGSNWTQPFTTESQPSLSFWNYVSAIAVSETNPDFVMIGINTQRVETGAVGEIYYSLDATSSASTWTQLSTSGANVLVNDLLMVEDSATGDAIIYVAAEYLSDGTNSSYAVKTIEYTASTSSFTYDNLMPSASFSTSITNFSAAGLAADSSGNIYVAGNTPSTGQPIAYILTPSASGWSSLATATLPSVGTVTAITVGEDSLGNEVPFIAVGESIYNLDGSTGTTWNLAYTYPTGTNINVLYWDELLVGTGTGLYAQKFPTNVAYGSTFTLKATSLGEDRRGDEFADDVFSTTPWSRAFYNHLESEGNRRIAKVKPTIRVTTTPVATAQMEFLGDKAILLNKSLIDIRKTAEEYIPEAQVSSLNFDMETISTDSGGNRGPFRSGNLVLQAPMITQVTDTEGNDISSAGAGDLVTLKGHWYGIRPLRVWLEFEKNGIIRKAFCRVLGRHYIYETVRGRPSPMDATSPTGESQITVQLPTSFPAIWNAESSEHNIVLENFHGRTTVDFTTTE